MAMLMRLQGPGDQPMVEVSVSLHGRADKLVELSATLVLATGWEFERTTTKT